MTTDDVMADVRQDWLQACDVQERFMRSPGRNHSLVDDSACCRKMRALAGGVVDVDLSICRVSESYPLRSGHNRRKCWREVVTIAPGEGEPLCRSFVI
jgi:hypothetical protein